MVLSEELQTLLDVMLVMAKALADMMDQILPAIGQLQNVMMNVQDLNLLANNEFKQVCTLYYCTVSYIHKGLYCIYCVCACVLKGLIMYFPR